MSIGRQFGAFMRDFLAGNFEIRSEKENTGDGQVPILFVANDPAADIFKHSSPVRTNPGRIYMHPRDLYLWTRAWPAVYAAYPKDEAPPMRLMKSKKWERRRSKPYAKRLIAMDAMCARIMSVYDAEAKKNA